MFLVFSGLWAEHIEWFGLGYGSCLEDVLCLMEKKEYGNLKTYESSGRKRYVYSDVMMEGIRYRDVHYVFGKNDELCQIYVICEKNYRSGVEKKLDGLYGYSNGKCGCRINRWMSGKDFCAEFIFEKSKEERGKKRIG